VVDVRHVVDARAAVVEVRVLAAEKARERDTGAQVVLEPGDAVGIADGGCGRTDRGTLCILRESDVGAADPGDVDGREERALDDLELVVVALDRRRRRLRSRRG
jgi:hypothetical protein